MAEASDRLPSQNHDQTAPMDGAHPVEVSIRST